MCTYVTVEFSVLYFHVVCLEWVNDETCLNVESGRLLEEGTFECGNVGKNMFDRIKYCSNYH